jgi:hypothetical protein
MQSSKRETQKAQRIPPIPACLEHLKSIKSGHVVRIGA